MPWKETSAVDERMRLVSLVNEGLSISEASRRFGVSRQTAHEWVKRYASEGLSGLLDRSRAPLHHPNATSEEVVERILDVRERYGWGAVAIRAHLMNTEPALLVPAASTIGALLKAHGRVVPPKRRHLTPRTEPLSHCDGPNRVWCADFKGWFRTGDGQRCDPLTITDGYSRYLLCCQILKRTTRESVEPLFEMAFREFGLPVAIRTDNGVPFASTKGLGLSRMAVKWIKYGVTPERIRPGKPQENGRHERMHRTLKDYTLKPPASTWRKQQARFDAFKEQYNHIRPHQGIDLNSPGKLYRPSMRTLPPRLPQPEYPSDWLIRRVYEKGSFCFGEKAIHLSEVLQNEYIALAPGPADRYLAIYFGHVCIAYLDTKYQRVRTRLPKKTNEEKEKGEHP